MLILHWPKEKAVSFAINILLYPEISRFSIRTWKRQLAMKSSPYSASSAQFLYSRFWFVINRKNQVNATVVKKTLKQSSFAGYGVGWNRGKERTH